MTHLLGLDLGTSAVKALLVSSEPAHPAASSSIDLPLSSPWPGWSEQDPAIWWEATCRAIRTLLEGSMVDAREIAGVAVSGQMHGATLLDRSGSVLRQCILWNDQRSGPECEWITERVGLDRLLRWVGNPALAGFTAPKLLWVRQHEPENFARMATVLLPKDYVNFLLTGNLATDFSDASGTLLFDVANRCWSDDMVAALEIDRSVLPPVAESTAVIGEVSVEAAAATGLATGTPVVAGGADNACAAVGIGVVQPGRVLVSLGTSGTLVAPMDTPAVDISGRLHTFCHAVPDTWYAMGVVLSAGGSLRWLRDTVFETSAGGVDQSGTDPYDSMLEEAQRISPGSEGLIFLPYLTGERTPHGDPDARGVFFGLSLRHGRNHLTRSVVEGVAFALADSADLMRGMGVEFETARMTGGGARSSLWRLVLASTLRCRMLTSTHHTGPAFGAAILAGVGAGIWSSVHEAADALVEIGRETEPEEALAEVYQRYHGLYDALYPALVPAFNARAALV